MKNATKLAEASLMNPGWGRPVSPPAPAPTSIAPVQDPKDVAVLNGYIPTAPGQPGYNQMIAIGQASPHLPFRDWLARGVVSAIGRMLAWPFKLVGDILHSIAMAVVGIVKMIFIIVLIPSMLILGLKIAAMQQEEESVRGSAAAAAEGVMEAGKGAINGREGASNEAP